MIDRYDLVPEDNHIHVEEVKRDDGDYMRVDDVVEVLNKIKKLSSDYYPDNPAAVLIDIEDIVLEALDET